ncbi:MAG: TPM domain-containing protein, partial [Nanoarchaeota archaeon]|nr:TPM domain-containing protein [Nanoarchaeota archaeon]
MKKSISHLFLFLLMLSSAIALPVDQVRLTDYVNDYTNTLSQTDIQSISSLAKSLQENGAAQVAVVLVDNFDDLSKEEYAIQIAHEHLGDTKTDNGLLILIGKEVREYRIEVGYGLEGNLNDAKIGRISREVLQPALSQGDYGQGIHDFIQAVGSELLPEGIPPPQGYTSSADSS